MIIGLEASRANRPDKTGTEWYAWHLLQEFKRIDQNHIFNVYFNQDLEPGLAVAPANFCFQQLRWDLPKLWTHFRLSWELFNCPVDKFFASNAVPLYCPGEVTLTVHDLGFYRNPSLYHPLERIYHKVSHYIAIHRADKIIAVSAATKKDIIKYFPEAKEKIRVIYNGWNKDDFRPASEETKHSIRQKYDLPNNFLLYLGRLETKKNILNLIKAYQLLKNKDWPLVLAGRPGNFGYDEILNLINSVKEGQVIQLGYLPQDDYQKLIASSSIFVFPSKFEGFGIPILEAMGSGVPVICSDIEVLHEVADDDALYFDPDRPEKMAEVIDNLIENKEKREEYIERGLIRATHFAWDKCAHETLNYILE
ncbi:MAG: glycosyltransferase family 1 protein [Candidatus Komeilibacteria bacterium]